MCEFMTSASVFVSQDVKIENLLPYPNGFEDGDIRYITKPFHDVIVSIKTYFFTNEFFFATNEINFFTNEINFDTYEINVFTNEKYLVKSEFYLSILK